ncbi:MAG: hypothetical protein RJA35_1056 [Actinomycetota bacterium]
MRFLTAAILFVVSAMLILVGIAQKTVWHPAPSHTQTISVTDKTPLIIIKHEALAHFDSTPVVSVSGSDKSFIGFGRQADVDSWVGSTKHVEITSSGSENDLKLTSKAFAGTGKLGSPLGSDLWRRETTATGPATIKVPLAQRAAVLIASDGFASAPNQITITWPISFNPVPSNILIIAGAVLMFAALVVNIWAWYNMRKLRGPRRRTPRAPQGPRLGRRRSTRSSAPGRGRRSARNLSVAVTGALMVASLAGCSVAPDAKASSTSTAATSIQQPPVATMGQVKNIVNRVATAIAAADASHDSKALDERAAGPAFAARKAHYILQKASKKVDALPPIPTKILSLTLPAASNLWPRSIMVITSNGGSESLPQMLVLQQKSPRSQYKLWYDIDMLPGAKLPVVNTAAVGAIPIASDSLFLKIAPNALPAAFGDLIDNGTSSLSAASFDVSNDEYYKQVYASQQSQISNLSNATIKNKHFLADPNVISLSTVNSGALVAVFMNDKYVIKPKNNTQAVAVAGDEKLMLGAAGSTTGVKSIYGTMLLFYVPAIASKDKIVTLGATQQLLSVKAQ